MSRPHKHLDCTFSVFLFHETTNAAYVLAETTSVFSTLAFEMSSNDASEIMPILYCCCFLMYYFLSMGSKKQREPSMCRLVFKKAVLTFHKILSFSLSRSFNVSFCKYYCFGLDISLY